RADPSLKPSKRPLETVTPLAERLGLPVEKWVQGREAALAAEINAMPSGIVLVSWEHKLIGRALLPGLLGDAAPSGVPQKWKAWRYDVVLRLDRAGPGRPWTFRQLFPCLLSGDSNQPM